MSENTNSDESKSKRGPVQRPAKSSGETAETAAAARRLKRVAPSQKDSRLARLSRARRANTSPVKHPRDLLGVSLAGGRYVVKSPLGKGSMAYVFRVSDARLQTDVVLKVPKPEKINTADFRERFQRESQMLIRFSHPHVVKVLDVGEYAELPYVVMQLLEGGSLSDRIANESDDNGCMTPESLKSWVREVARALDFCYRKGMVHRDVKPANILFDEDKNAYVGDFGLSKIMGGEHAEMSSDETAAGVVLGTPNYISPEVVQGKDYDGRSDQYSLGITIYHVLTGGPPMQGNTATMTMLNQTQMVLPLLSDVRDDVPRPLAVAVRKAIEKDPDRRFNTCVEFAEAVIEGLRFAPMISTSSHSSSSMNSKSASASSRKLRSQPISEAEAKPTTGEKSAAKLSPDGVGRKQRNAEVSKKTAKQKTTVQGKKRRETTAGASSRASQKRKSSASSAAALEADLDWFDMNQSGDFLPGRSSASSRSASSRSSSSRSRSSQSSSSRSSSRSSGSRRARQAKAADGKRIQVFGQQLHPAFLAAFGFCAIFALVMIVWSPWAADEFSPQLAAGQYHPTSQASSPKNRNQPAKRIRKQSQSKATQDRPSRNVVAATHDPPGQGASMAKEASTDGTAANENALDSGPSSPIKDFLASQDSNPIFPLPAGSLTHFGDGTAARFVSGRSVRSRKTGEQTALLSGDYAADGLATLSNDGRWFAATTTGRSDRDYRVRVWNTKTGRIELDVVGDGRRSLRNLFLSDKYLYLETDRSHQLQAWNLTSRRQQGVLILPAERLRRQRMGITRDGAAFAALVGDHLSIINGVSGAVTTRLDSPLASPVQVAMANSSVPLTRLSPVKMLQSLSGIQFSNNQSQLAAIRATPVPALMTWDELGHLQYDLPVAVAANDCQPRSVQWFDQRSAWLVNGSVIDAKHRQIVLAVPHGDQQKAMIALQDDDHLMSTIRTDVTNVYRRRIPWELIDKSLNAMADDETSLLKPGSSVQLTIEIEDGNGTGVVLRPLLENAIKQRLAADRIAVDNNAPLTFKLTSRRGLQQNGEATVLELIDAQSSRLVWYAELGQSLNIDPEIFETRRQAAEAIATRIASLAIPYYVPSDSDRIMLPHFIDE